VSKMFPLADGIVLLLLLAFGVCMAATNGVALVLAATSCDQAFFVPGQVIATLLVNMITGLILWEDWRTVRAWIAYIAVHFIMTLGIYLMSPLDALKMYQNQKRAKAANHLMNGELHKLAGDEHPEAAKNPDRKQSSVIAWNAMLTTDGAQLGPDGNPSKEPPAGAIFLPSSQGCPPAPVPQTETSAC